MVTMTILVGGGRAPFLPAHRVQPLTHRRAMPCAVRRRCRKTSFAEQSERRREGDDGGAAKEVEATCARDRFEEKKVAQSCSVKKGEGTPTSAALHCIGDKL